MIGVDDKKTLTSKPIHDRSAFYQLEYGIDAGGFMAERALHRVDLGKDLNTGDHIDLGPLGDFHQDVGDHFLPENRPDRRIDFFIVTMPPWLARNQLEVGVNIH